MSFYDYEYDDNDPWEDDDPFDADEYAEYYSDDEDIYSDYGGYVADHC